MFDYFYNSKHTTQIWIPQPGKIREFMAWNGFVNCVFMTAALEDNRVLFIFYTKQDVFQ